MAVFYDTSSLLEVGEGAFNGAPFYISSVTLEELENIKTSATKSEDTKFKARRLTRLLDEKPGNYKVVIATTKMREMIEGNLHLSITPDNLILACASMVPDCECVYSEDICMRHIGKNVFGLPMMSCAAAKDKETPYTGYKQVQMSDSEFAIFQNTLEDNPFGCLVNEYLIVYGTEYEVQGCYRWTGNEFVPAYNKTIKSFSVNQDKLKPLDEFQRCAIDSLMNPDIKFVCLAGKPGSGKTTLNLVCAMSQVDCFKYDRMVFSSNNVPLRGVASYGYTPGTITEKLLSANAGQILLSKFEEALHLNGLIMQDKIRLLDFSTIRGSEFKNTVVFCSEMQNTSPDIVKTIISRMHESSKLLFDFDAEAQVDVKAFEANNGARRAVEALKGQPEFAYIYLPNIYRSNLAKLAELI
jgi:PhoH-like ATPase